MAIGPIQPARFTEWHANPIVRPSAARAATAVPSSTARSSSGTQCGIRVGREVVRARPGLALDGDAGGRRPPERRVDRHVGADPVALEAERLEQHPGARVRGVDAGPDVAGDRAREQHVVRAELARRGRSPRATSSLPRPRDWCAGMHDDEHEPRRDVFAEALDLHDRGAALVAEDLVGVAVLVRAEAEVRELARR